MSATENESYSLSTSSNSVISSTTTANITLGFTIHKDGEIFCGQCQTKLAEGSERCPSCDVQFLGTIGIPNLDGLVEETEEAAVVEIEINAEGADSTEPDEDDAAAAEEASTLPTWEGEIAYEGMPTSDGRVLMSGLMSNRELPLTLMCQTVTDEGHMGAEVCGKITSIWREDRPELGDGVVAVMAAGEFSCTEPMGERAASMVAEQVLNGVSVDVAPTARHILSAETLETVAEEDFDFEVYVAGGYVMGIEGDYMGATLVPFPAFADAKMWISGAVVASAEDQVETLTISMASPSLKIIPRAITASAAGIAPIAPPRDWFFTPEPEGKFPLTVMDDGRIMGHLCTWDQCHHGFLNECVLAKPSRTNYSFFHNGSLKTKEGEFVDVGRIVVAETSATGHANIQHSLARATEHYDKSAMVGAFVRATDGKYGVWLSGVVRSDCPAEKVRDMLANPPSGDWRSENGWLELIAALSVPVPGFPVPRYEYALTASAESTEVMTLIATGYFELDKPTYSRAEMRRREILLNKARGLVS